MDDQLRGVAARLHERRAEILRDWHQRVAADPALTSASSISRTQFNDHIPQVLDAFEHRLSAQSAAARDAAVEEQRGSAAEHGLHRWQQGYDQSQTMREWVHLHLCLLDELERYGAEQPAIDAATKGSALRELARLCGDGVCESATRYARLSQLEAASRVRDLEQGIEQLNLLERERAARWREAAHDLRSTVSVVTTAAAVLDRDGVPEPARAQMSQILQRGAISLHELLTDLADLARLEAGQERRNIVQFDAAHLVKEFCAPLRALAAQRGLFFHTEGCEHLPVEGDPVKVQRIAQNLATNALKATAAGGVRVTWSERDTGDRRQWVLCVQDTGPGLNRATAAPLERALQRATEEAHQIETEVDPAPTLASRSAPEAATPVAAGEGIGLSIVKRLCELLDASLELETAPGEGTTFRVVFPRQYSD
jgi:signal transduction histidine kinase